MFSAETMNLTGLFEQAFFHDFWKLQKS